MNTFDFNVLVRAWPLLLQGFWFTLELTCISAIGGVVLGTALALARLSGNKAMSTAVRIWVNLVRSVPLLLVIFWFYFLVPFVAAWATGSRHPVEVGALMSCVITFIIFEACYFCEIMRAGIQSIPAGQFNAGRALGMSYGTIMARIILPQALRNMLPVLLSQVIVLFQDVSLVSVLSMKDFFGMADLIAKRDDRLHEMYLTVAVVYLVLCLGLSRAVKLVQSRTAIIQ